MSRQQNQMAVRFRPLLAENEGEIKWEHTLDTIFAPGCYSIEIDHTKENVGLPLIYCGEDHYIVGNLVVTDSGTKGPKQHNRLTGQKLTVTDRKSGATKIYTRTFCDGAWSEWRSLVESGAFKNISSTEELVATVEALSGSVETLMGEGEGSVQEAVNEAFIAADKKITENSDSIKDIVTGDTQIALAREIYSLQGKSDTGSFLKRTTAGNTTIHSGVARIKQVGGSIVKNLVDGQTFKDLSVLGGTYSIANGILVFESNSSTGKGSMRNYNTPKAMEIEGHVYYQSCMLKCSENPENKVFLGWGSLSNSFPEGKAVTSQAHTNWQLMSVVYTSFSTINYHSVVIGDKRTSSWGTILVRNLLHIDLTEMFGAGNEPSKEECDAMFATMEALPKGLTVATPTTFKSVGYNHCDTSEAMFGRSIVDGYISDGSNILVFMPCVPCKLGEGENNGYVIATGEGDSWSEENIKAVYFTPFNPQTTGELYLDKLEPQLCRQCNDTHNVYLPECAGYLIIETTTTEKLCAHLAWSGDRAVTDYEPYTESLVSLPEIQQMSAWGLAGVSSANDTLDFERLIYKKCIKRIDLRTANFVYSAGAYSDLKAWKDDTGNIVYTEKAEPKAGQYIFDKEKGVTNNIISLIADDFSYISFNDTIYYRYTDGDLNRPCFRITLSNKMINGTAFVSGFFRKHIGGYGSLKCSNFNKAIARGDMSNDGMYNALFFSFHEYTDAETLKEYFVNNLTDEQAMIFYASVGEEYSIDDFQRTAYLADDYGTEEFTGSLVPPCNNRFFYMRSLVGEMRNFIDRLYALFTTTDAKYVANRIYNAVTSATDATEAVEE